MTPRRHQAVRAEGPGWAPEPRRCRTLFQIAEAGRSLAVPVVGRVVRGDGCSDGFRASCRQTTRHEVAVAAASARYAAAGYAWQRDDKPAYAGGHQADGVSLASEWVELTEVELTGKRMPRYLSIFHAFQRRFDYGEMRAVTYLCNAESARTVREALKTFPVGRAIAPRVQVREVYDERGFWNGDELPMWLLTAGVRVAHERRAQGATPSPSAE